MIFVCVFVVIVFNIDVIDWIGDFFFDDFNCVFYESLVFGYCFIEVEWEEIDISYVYM